MLLAIYPKDTPAQTGQGLMPPPASWGQEHSPLGFSAEVSDIGVQPNCPFQPLSTLRFSESPTFSPLLLGPGHLTLAPTSVDKALVRDLSISKKWKDPEMSHM